MRKIVLMTVLRACLTQFHLSQLLMILIAVSLLSCGDSDGFVPAVTIDLSGAQALFKVPKVSSSPSLGLKEVASDEGLGLLRKILSDGTVKSVIYEDAGGKKVVSKISPSRVFIGPDKKIYITFNHDGVLVNGKQCFLLRGNNEAPLDCIGPEDGFMEKSDDKRRSPVDEMGMDGRNLARVTSHFDATNNFYYLEKVDPWTLKKLSPDGKVSDKVTLREDWGDFSVGPDGTVFFGGAATGPRMGRTTATGIADLPVILTESGFDFLVSSSGDLFVNNMRLAANLNWSVSETISLPFTPRSGSSALVNEAVRFNITLFEDSRGNVYTLQGNLDEVKSDRVYRIYPGKSVAVTSSGIRIDSVRTEGSFLYYAGTDFRKKNIFRRINLLNAEFPEVDLLQGADMEVYRFRVRSNGDVVFGGLRPADNQWVIGEIDGKTREMTVKATTTTRIDDLVLVVE